MSDFNHLPGFCTPHCHISSFDSASTPEAFAKRELELNSGYLVVTDHGSLEAARKVYDLCHTDKRFAGKLRPIIGVEAYFRDDNCPILKDSGVPQSLRFRNQLTNQCIKQESYDKLDSINKQIWLPEYGFWDHVKYHHITMHAMDEEAYSTLCRLLSKADFKSESHGAERKPLFNWADLEELGSKNITFSSSCLIGMVSRHLLANDDPTTAVKYYERVRSLVKPGNFIVELFPHNCDRNWEEGVFVKFSDGTEQKFPEYKNMMTKAGKIKAEDLAKDFARDSIKALKKHEKLMGYMQNRKMEDIEPKDIVAVERREGFLLNECRPWAPDGDVQLGANNFVLELAEKYGDLAMISDDSHMATPDEKTAQDVRLGQLGSWRFANTMHRFSNDEAWDYFKTRMGMSQAKFESLVVNNHIWASKFKDFKFTSKKVLPTSFYPSNTLDHLRVLIDKHGRMDWNDEKWVNRLQEEVNLLHYNGVIDLLPYFFIDEQVAEVYLKSGRLTGPGRGSAGGLGLTYLLGITHIDPIKYELSVDRFLTKSRIESGKLPDIDQDLDNRDLLEGSEYEAFEIELEDGTLKTIPAGAKVKTSKGLIEPERAFKEGLDIEFEGTK